MGLLYTISYRSAIVPLSREEGPLICNDETLIYYLKWVGVLGGQIIQHNVRLFLRRYLDSLKNNQSSPIQGDEKLASGWENSKKEQLEEGLEEVLVNYRNQEGHLYEKQQAYWYVYQDVNTKINEQAAEMKKKEPERNNLNNSWVPWNAYCWLVVFALLELPINAKVFDVFHEAKMLTYLMAAGVGIILIVVAHIAGVLNRWRAPLWKQLIPVIFTVVALGTCSVLRSGFVTQAGIESGQTSVISPWIIITFFWVINLLFFYAAAALGYYSHDSNPEFAKAYEAREKLLKDKVILETNIATLKSQRVTNYENANSEIESYQNFLQGLAGIYRQANILEREEKDRIVPAFEKAPRLDIKNRPYYRGPQPNLPLVFQVEIAKLCTGNPEPAQSHS